MPTKPTVMLRLPFSDDHPLQLAFIENRFHINNTRSFRECNKANHPEFQKNTMVFTLTYTGDKNLIQDAMKASRVLETDLHLFLPAFNLFAHVNARGLKSLTNAQGNPNALTPVILRVPHAAGLNRTGMRTLLTSHGFKPKELAGYENNGDPAWAVDATYAGVNLTQAVSQVAMNVKQAVLLRIPKLQIRTNIKPPTPTRLTEPLKAAAATI